ncbi:MAG: hypothetical protein ABI594_03960 [Ginsengibacter sp.]
MISSIKILTEASVDIKEIVGWYKNISQPLAARFISQLYDGFERISSNPNAWFNISKKARRYRLSDFPYLILFFRRVPISLYLRSFMKREILRHGKGD